MLFLPLLPFLFDSFKYSGLQFVIAYLIIVIFGILLAYFFKLFLWAVKKLEDKIPDVLVFLLKALILLVSCFFIFCAVYFLFLGLSSIHAANYFYTPYSWDSPPTGPYYIFTLSIILSLFLGSNKKYLIYNVFILLTLSLLFSYKIDQFSFDIKSLYLTETLYIKSLYENLISKWRYFDILLLLSAFFSSSLLFILISSKVKSIRKNQKNSLGNNFQSYFRL